MKKAQGMSLNTIIIAALVIMVLVILILVFTGRMGNFSATSESCQAKSGGTCKSGCGENEMPAPLGGTCPANEVCCVAKII